MVRYYTSISKMKNTRAHGAGCVGSSANTGAPPCSGLSASAPFASYNDDHFAPAVADDRSFIFFFCACFWLTAQFQHVVTSFPKNGSECATGQYLNTLIYKSQYYSTLVTRSFGMPCESIVKFSRPSTWPRSVSTLQRH